MNFVSAAINFGEEVKQEIAIEKEAVSADFKVQLKPGKTQFKAQFLNSKGEKNVAYYVYINKI